jgi:hypothetical protein
VECEQKEPQADICSLGRDCRGFRRLCEVGVSQVQNDRRYKLSGGHND